MVQPTREAVASAIDPRKAQVAVASALAVAGAQPEWTSETIEWVVAALLRALPAGAPSPAESSPDSVEFWSAVDNS